MNVRTNAFNWDDVEINKGISNTSFYTENNNCSKLLQNTDNVNHPSHYNRPNGMECIDEMILLFGIEETKTFCKLNAWKYRYRAADKNGIEDLNKSDWYLKKYKELSLM